MNLQEDIEKLFSDQMEAWPQLCNAVSQIDNVQTKHFLWGNGVEVTLQFNPARIVSTGAKVDAKNIGERPCFLCEGNRPKEQTGIPFLGKYLILCNPFPILQRHLTIPLYTHVPQRIRKKAGDMLALAEALPDYIVFYNGPEAGASAPDHFHLQAGLKSPALLAGDNELRSCLVIEGYSVKEMEDRFEDVYQYLRSRQPEKEEPLLNIIAFVDNGKYILHVFPRKAHRPRQYFADAARQLLVSPGAIDMAGLVITVREEDFNTMTKNDIEDIYSQVSMPII
ncbi:MAG: DUF4922 domain-containing protein [Dysgonamonadaceae bacterium]|jgi:hypothetical protein|nr:DUF4922 domain-containing protein [Dysgonamonadaceae bacterium]